MLGFSINPQRTPSTDILISRMQIFWLPGPWLQYRTCKMTWLHIAAISLLVHIGKWNQSGKRQLNYEFREDRNNYGIFNNVSTYEWRRHEATSFLLTQSLTHCSVFKIYQINWMAMFLPLTRFTWAVFLTYCLESENWIWISISSPIFTGKCSSMESSAPPLLISSTIQENSWFWIIKNALVLLQSFLSCFRLFLSFPLRKFIIYLISYVCIKFQRNCM